MKTRSLFPLVLLLAVVAAIFATTTHAQIGIVVPHPRGYGYYHPHYPPYAHYYSPLVLPFRAGGRPEASSGINFQFNGIPGALLDVIEHSNVFISGKKLNGCVGAAGGFSNRGSGRIALPPGIYDVEIRLSTPYTPINVKGVLVRKQGVVTLALPIENLIGSVPRVFSPQPPRSGSRIAPIPNTKPMAVVQ